MHKECLNLEKMNEPDDIDLAVLRKLCSRLDGDALCRCGSNMNGRYCLWSYYRMTPSSAKPEKNPAGARTEKVEYRKL